MTMDLAPERLVELVGCFSKGRDAGSSYVTIDELTDALSSLAVALREEEAARIALETSDLHRNLASLLEREDPDEEERDQLLEQVGRVAANLGADNANNLDRLLAAEYPQRLVQRLSGASRPSTSSAVRALVASLLNAVASDHESTKDILSDPSILRNLIALARDHFDESDQDETRAGISLWLWRIIADLSEHRPANLAICLDSDVMNNLLQPLAFFRHEGAKDVTGGTQDMFLSVLEYCCSSIAAMSEIEPDGTPAETPVPPCRPFIDNATATSTLLQFIELATLPSHWTYDEPQTSSGEEDDSGETDMTQEACEKRLGKSKASVIQMIIHISWDIPYDPSSAFWARMLDWTAKGPERDDLISCGYLSLGNGAKNGEIAESLLRGPTSILPSLLNVLKPTTQVTTQHAVVSLLRNIAIPPANKTILGDAGITELLVRMGVFDDTRDMVETVQGGAAVVIKLLCQANASNAENFVLSDAAVAQVLAVIKRVDTPSVAFESSRIFANCIKSLTSDHRAKHVESVARLSQSDVIEIYVDLLRRTTKYPLLTNDAVISLTLVTTFGPDGSASRVLQGLEKTKSAKEEELASGKEVLARIVSTAPEDFSKEIRANTSTLLGQLKERTGGDVFERIGA